MKAYLQTIIGTYQPVQVSGGQFLDVPYIVGAVVFCMCLIFVFKMFKWIVVGR